MATREDLDPGLVFFPVAWFCRSAAQQESEQSHGHIEESALPRLPAGLRKFIAFRNLVLVLCYIVKADISHPEVHTDSLYNIAHYLTCCGQTL